MANMARSKRNKNSVSDIQKHDRVTPSTDKSAKSRKPAHSAKSDKPVKRVNRQISENFYIYDFACRHPDCAKKPAVKVSLGLIGALELLQYQLKTPIQVIKGYECEAHKTISVYKNYYRTGLAAQIRAETIDLIDLFKAADAIPDFKGIGLDFDNNCLYVDTRKDTPQQWVIKNQRRTDLTGRNRKKWIPT